MVSSSIVTVLLVMGILVKSCTDALLRSMYMRTCHGSLTCTYIGSVEDVIWVDI